MAETISISFKKAGMIMVETIVFEWPRTETELVNILRWEDDGGTIIADDQALLARKRRKPMKKRVGLWLDRNKAVIVSIVDNVEARRIITSDMEHYVLYSTIVPGDGSPEYIRDRRFWNHLGEYYEKILADLRDATEIQIFGPDLAKYELQQHLEHEGLAEHIVSLENAEKLTDPQIAAKVQKRFPTRSRFELF